MTGGVYKVEYIVFTIFAPVGEGDGLALYGNSPFAFDVHAVKDLILEIAVIDHTTVLNHPVSQGGLTVIYMCYYAEITYILHNKIKSLPVYKGRLLYNFIGIFTILIFQGVLH